MWLRRQLAISAEHQPQGTESKLPTDWRHFRKLAERPSSRFRRLPLWVRGMADEMVRYATRPDGLVSDSPDKQDIADLLYAHPDEVDQVGEAVAALLGIGFLEVREGGLYIANFSEAQQSVDARRKRESRGTARKQADSQPVGEPVRDVRTERTRPECPDTLKDQTRLDQTRPDQITETRATSSKDPGAPKARDRQGYFDAHDDPDALWAFGRWVEVFGLTPDTERTPRRMSALMARLKETRDAKRDWRADVDLVLKAGKASEFVANTNGGELLRMFDVREQFERFRRGPPKPKPGASPQPGGDLERALRGVRRG